MDLFLLDSKTTYDPQTQQPLREVLVQQAEVRVDPAMLSPGILLASTLHLIWWALSALPHQGESDKEPKLELT